MEEILTMTASRSHHVPYDGLRAIEDAFQIHPYDLVPFLFFHPHEKLVPRDTCIIDKVINAAHIFDHPINSLAYHLKIRNIYRQEFCLPPHTPDGLHHLAAVEDIKNRDISTL